MTKRTIFKPLAPAMPSILGAYDAMSAAGMLDCRETSTLKPQTEIYAEKYPNDRWDLFEALPKFRAWACDPFVHTNGSRYRYAVVSRAPFPGLAWVCLRYTLPSASHPMPELEDESGGAFYDGDERHPEGAIEWAKSCALVVKLRNFESADWEQRQDRAYDEAVKRRPLPPGDPGVLDEKWKAALISIGYAPEKAHRLSLRPTPPPISPELPGKLAAIKVLWLMPDTLALYGIPYPMREGQSPSDLRRAHDEYVEPAYGHYGSKRIDLSNWIWLGSPGWWGSKSNADIAAIEAWLALPHVKPNIPERPGEWSAIGEPGVDQ